jgi:ABC-2 type transport system permease protein
MHSLITDLFGPIFAKEMVEMARRWRYYQNRMIFATVVLFTLFVVYQNTYYRYTMRGGWTLQTLSKMAEAFFESYLWVQFVSVFLFVPFFLTGVISGEREQKTLDLLFTTQLSNRDIIFGKLGSRVVTMLLIILSGIPIIALTMLFGGVNSKIFYHGMLGTLVALLYVSSTAIYFSTITKTTLGALVRTYWWMLSWVLLVPMLIMFFVQALAFSMGPGTIGPGTTGGQWIEIGALITAVINPVGPFVVGTNNFLGFQFSTRLGNYYFYIMMIPTIMWSLLLLVLAIWRVRKEPTASKLLARIRGFFRLVLGIIFLKPITSRIMKRVPAAKSDRWFFGIASIENPLWQRSRRAYVYDRENHLQRAQIGGWLLFLVVILAMVFLEPHAFESDELAIFILGWIWFGLLLIGCLTAGLTIVNDRRRGFFDLILVTPMRPLEVIWGTFLAVWRHIKKLYLLVLSANLLFVLTGQIYLSAALVSVIIGTLAVSLFILESIISSLVARTVAGGLTAAFALPLIVLLFFPILGAMARQESASLYISLTVILLVLSLVIRLFWRSTFTLMLLMLAMHMVFLILFTVWVVTVRDNEMPVVAIHAGFQTLEILERNDYGSQRYRQEMWHFAKFMFCAATVCNILWLLWWVRWNYEVLCGRKEIHRRKRHGPSPAIDPPHSPSKMTVDTE